MANPLSGSMQRRVLEIVDAAVSREEHLDGGEIIKRMREGHAGEAQYRPSNLEQVIALVEQQGGICQVACGDTVVYNLTQRGREALAAAREETAASS